MQCDIVFARGIARPETREVSSLSVEEQPGAEIVVSLFEVEASPESIAAFIQREHEFRWGLFFVFVFVLGGYWGHDWGMVCPSAGVPAGWLGG